MFVNLFVLNQIALVVKINKGKFVDADVNKIIVFFLNSVKFQTRKLRYTINSFTDIKIYIAAYVEK